MNVPQMQSTPMPVPTFLPVLLPTSPPEHGMQVGPLLPYLLALYVGCGLILALVVCRMAGCCCFAASHLPASPRQLTPRDRSLQAPLLAPVTLPTVGADAQGIAEASWDGGNLGDDEARGRSPGSRPRPPTGSPPYFEAPPRPEAAAALLEQQREPSAVTRDGRTHSDPAALPGAAAVSNAGASEAMGAGKTKMTIEEALLDEMKPGSVGFLEEGFTEATATNWKQFRGSGDEVLLGSVDNITNRRRENMSWRLWWRAQAARSKKVREESPLSAEEQGVDLKVFTDVPPGPPAEGFVYVALREQLVDAVRLLISAELADDKMDVR